MGKKKLWLKNVSEDYLRENFRSFRWEDILRYKSLSESFIREFADEIYWPTVMDTQSFSKDFAREMNKQLSYYSIFSTAKYDEKFIEEIINTFKDDEKRFIVYNACMTQDLSEEFLEKYKQYLDWDCVSRHVKLTPNFMRNNKHLLRWGKVVRRGCPIPEDLKEYVTKELMIERVLSDIE